MEFDTPILLIVFNRPDTTLKVFEAIKEQKPKYLYIAADGPRDGNAKDAVNCPKVRDIVSKIDWPCKVNTLFRITNLGCHKAVPEAITWFFSHVEKGIILEDDCLPDPSFFSFCEKLLERYKDNPTIMMISGDNFIKQIKFQHSYAYSKYAFIWGWATWRSSWERYDERMTEYPKFRNTIKFKQIFGTIFERLFWLTAFDNKYSGKKQGWDTKWVYALMKNEGLSVIPSKNLVTNLGFSEDATTTSSGKATNHVFPFEAMEFPLTHPETLQTHLEYDKKVFQQVFLSTVSFKIVLHNYIPALKKIWH